MNIPKNKVERRLDICRAHLAAEIKGSHQEVMATFVDEPSFVMNGVELSGKEQVGKFYEEFLTAFEGIVIREVRNYIADDCITMEGVISGRLVRDWMGLPAKGKGFSVPLCAIFRFNERDELLAEHVYFDGSQLLLQLKLIPQPGSLVARIMNALYKLVP